MKDSGHKLLVIFFLFKSCFIDLEQTCYYMIKRFSLMSIGKRFMTTETQELY